MPAIAPLLAPEPPIAAPEPPSIPPTLPPSPLLPSVLLGPVALFWLWLLPIAILLLLNFQGYQLISGNMDAAQLASAHQLGLAALVNLLVGAAALFLAARPPSRTPAVPEWAVPAAAILVQVAYLWFAISAMDKLIPRSVAPWIFPPERFLFNQFAFAMLPLAHGALRLACLRPVASLNRTIGFSLALAVGAPLAIYVLGHLIRTLVHAGPVLIATVVIGCGLALFVGVVRALMCGLQKLRAWPATTERVAIAVVALVFPIAGLLLNRHIPFPVDFQAREAYALTVVNAALLLFASWQHARRPLLSLGLLCGTLPFALYFFVVFLPYLPLAIFAIAAFGLGFLILTPTLLLVLQLHLLNQARRSLPASLSRDRLAAVALACTAILPGFFVVRAAADRAALHAALDYVYTPALNHGAPAYPASLANLRRALDSHRHYKHGLSYPLLSDFYGWFVFDHLVLPDDKIARLEATFFGTETPATPPLRRGGFGSSSVAERTRMPRAANLPRNVTVTDLAIRTAPASAQDTTVTLALTLTNPAPSAGAADEYLATLPLPPGVFVTGFRLHIAGVPVPGRIFEKKTALWVYTMIRDSERRDPGLLYYRSPTELELRVFPVNAGTPSVVELDFLVPAAPAALAHLPPTRDPAVVVAQLGAPLQPRLAHDAGGSAVATGLARLALPAAAREPFLHLLVDRSLQHGFNGDLAAALRVLRQRFPEARRARVTLAHHDVVDFVSEPTPLDQLAALHAGRIARTLPPSGGFALDLALARAIRQHRDADLDSPVSRASTPPRPIFVVLSRHAQARPLDLARTTEWADLLPHLELHEHGADSSFVTHRAATADDSPLLRLGESHRPLHRDRVARFAAPPLGARLEFWSPATDTWQPISGVTELPAASPWARALALQARQQDHARSPGDAAFDLKALVAASRDSGQLLAATSYIVVENAAQWRMLELSETRKLSQNAALSFRETPAPPALWVALAFMAWLALRRSSRLRRTRAA